MPLKTFTSVFCAWETLSVGCLGNRVEFLWAVWLDCCSFITLYIKICTLKATLLSTLNFLFLPPSQLALLAPQPLVINISKACMLVECFFLKFTSISSGFSIRFKNTHLWLELVWLPIILAFSFNYDIYT